MDFHRVKLLRLYGSIQQVTVGSRVYNPNLAVSLELIIYAVLLNILLFSRQYYYIYS